MAYLSECRETGRLPVIPEGIARIHPEIRQALAEHRSMSVETTGASQEILDGLMRLCPREKMIIVRISAPADLCLQRAEPRKSTHQIPLDAETINAMSDAAWVDADLQITNEALSDEEIVAAFREHL